MVVGKVQQLRGEEAIIDADGNITVHLNRVRNRDGTAVNLPNTPQQLHRANGPKNLGTHNGESEPIDRRGPS